MRSPVKVFIIDDEPDAVELLSRILTQNFMVEVVGTAATGAAAVKDLEYKSPDIIFLDIQLPDTSGLEFCNHIQQVCKPDTKVVFYTGYEQYMLDAIRHQAFDYLLKPATLTEVTGIMARFYENKLHTLPSLHLTAAGHLPQILVVNVRNEHMTLHLDTIAFFRYNNDSKQWEAVCTNHESYSLRHRTTSDMILNYSTKLIQTHKRYIVNMDHIRIIQENTCLLKAPMDHITEVKVSKNYKRDLINEFYNL